MVDHQLIMRQGEIALFGDEQTQTKAGHVNRYDAAGMDWHRANGRGSEAICDDYMKKHAEDFRLIEGPARPVPRIQSFTRVAEMADDTVALLVGWDDSLPRDHPTLLGQVFRTGWTNQLLQRDPTPSPSTRTRSRSTTSCHSRSARDGRGCASSASSAGSTARTRRVSTRPATSRSP